MICAEIADQRVVRDSCLRTVRPLVRLASPPVGDEVALFSAARHSGIPETKATVTPRAFGCGCAALSWYGAGLLPIMSLVAKVPTARCTSAAILGRAQPEWGQARSSQPLQIRSPDLRSRNWADIGWRIDAPGDGRAPDRDCFSNALGQPPQSLTTPSFCPPFFCPPFFCHSYFHFLSPISAITKKSFVGSFD